MMPWDGLDQLLVLTCPVKKGRMEKRPEAQRVTLPSQTTAIPVNAPPSRAAPVAVWDGAGTPRDRVQLGRWEGTGTLQ